MERDLCVLKSCSVCGGVELRGRAEAVAVADVTL